MSRPPAGDADASRLSPARRAAAVAAARSDVHDVVVVGGGVTGAGVAGVEADHVRRMLGRFGDEVADVLAPVRTDAALGRPLPGAPGSLAAEYRFGATHEQAMTFSDVLTRRTHVAIEHRDGGEAVAAAAARVVAPVLGWDAVEQARQVGDRVASVRADRAALGH